MQGTPVGTLAQPVAEHNFARGRLEVLQENMSQVYGFLLTQETRSDVEHWVMMRQGPELRHVARSRG